MPHYFKTIIIFFIVFSTYDNCCFAQIEQKNINPDSSYIRIFFNKKPDSLFIDGQKTHVRKNGSILPITAKKEFEAIAYLNRYKPIEKKITAVKKRITFVRFKFTHNFNILDRRLYPNHCLILGNIIHAGLLNRDELLYLAPTNGISFIQQFLWMLNRDDYLDQDTKFDYTPFSEKPFSFYYGITSLPVSESETILTATTTYTEKAKLTFTPGFAISIGLYYRLFSRFSIDANIDYFPFAKIKAGINNQFDPTRVLSIKQFSSEIEWRRAFYLISINANIEIMKILNQKWFLLFGGYYTPTEDVEKKFTVEKYYKLVGRPPSSIYETFSNSYQLSAKGFNTGFMVQSRYNTPISFYFRFKYYFNNHMEVNNEIDEKTLFNFFTGIQYHLQ